MQTKRNKLPAGQWDYYRACALSCLRDLDSRREGVVTSALAGHFLGDVVKSRQVLREMERRGLVTHTEPLYRVHLWRITDKGREYLSEQLIQS